MAATDSPVIDFSAHFYPPRPNETEEIDNNLRRVLRATEGPVYRDFAAAREHFENGSLDGAVLSQPSFLAHEDIEQPRAVNDNMLELIQTHPDFYGLASIPATAGSQVAAREFERCLENGMNGGTIQTWSHDDSVTIDSLDQIFEVADRYGAPIFIHPKVHGSLGSNVFEDKYRLNAVFGRAIALSGSIYSLIQEGHLEEYDDLNFVVHHMGGNIAGMVGRIRGVIERAERNAEAKGGPVDLKSFDEFYRQLTDHFYVDTAGFDGDSNVYQAALDVFPATNILFGSDYPCEVRNARDYQRLIKSIREGVDSRYADRILGQNALDLLVNT